MKNAIDEKNKKIKNEQRSGLMTHVVAGYPNIEETRKMILMMVKEGVDIIEIQIPFFDPLGDGQTIREANNQALGNGFKVSQAFELVRTLREKDKISIPLLFMTYFNIVHNYGIEKFCHDANDAGTNGLIVPDYDLQAESQDKLNFFAETNGLYLINFISLDSESEYIQSISTQSQGFVYCFSSRNVTGGSKSQFSEIIHKLAEIRKIVRLPLAVGFGVSSVSDVEKLAKYAQIIISGSAILRAYNSGGINEARNKMRELITGLST